MRDAFGVRGVKTLGNLDGYFEQTIERHRPRHDDVLQGHAIQEFHGDERLVLVLPNFVDRADVGMIQRRSCAGLATEAFEGMRARGDVIWKKFRSEERRVGKECRSRWSPY